MQREMDAMMSSFAPWLDDAFLAPRSSSLLSRSPIRSMLADLDTVMVSEPLLIMVSCWCSRVCMSCAPQRQQV
jgi:hypothetical protein